MSKDRVRATDISVSRRIFCTALPATGVTLALPASVASREADPLVPLYHEWLTARREWLALSDLPGNGNWDDPRSLAAEARATAAEDEMLAVTPTTLEGVGALAALAWASISPGTTDPAQFAERAKSYDCRAVMAIWKACTGREGYPVT